VRAPAAVWIWHSSALAMEPAPMIPFTAKQQSTLAPAPEEAWVYPQIAVIDCGAPVRSE
jgi:hypothetical protein